MLAIRSGRDWTIHCPAKLNLLLEITGRRGDGYHEIETIMVPIDLCDTLVIRPSTDNEIELSCNWAQGSGAQADWLELTDQGRLVVASKTGQLRFLRLSENQVIPVMVRKLPNIVGLASASPT